ncbi:MAG: hypothetical protein Q4B99_00045 [Clostridia bacterium]|nr:hypothetical protein [Clostridia bacterium]
MTKRLLAVATALLLLLTTGCQPQHPDVNGNSPEQVLELCIEAFKSLDAEGLDRYCMDLGSEATGGSAFGAMPDSSNTALRELMQLSFEALKVTDFDDLSVAGEGDSRSAKATVTIETYSVDSASQLFLDICIRNGITAPSSEQLLSLWLETYESGNVALVTATGDVFFTMKNGEWRVTADDDFALLLAGGAANTTGGA